MALDGALVTADVDGDDEIVATCITGVVTVFTWLLATRNIMKISFVVKYQISSVDYDVILSLIVTEIYFNNNKYFGHLTHSGI